jgi:hypothetical protein
LGTRRESVVEGDGEEVILMAKISVELRSGTAHFAVAVQAPTIEQALNVAATRFPGSPVRVKSPIERALTSKNMLLEWD